MIIEQFILNHLSEQLDAPVYGDIPSPRPARFITVEQTGSRQLDYINTANIAVQSWAQSRAEAALLNEAVKKAMQAAAASPDISRCHLESDYNYTDLATKTPRYQAVFEVVHFV